LIGDDAINSVYAWLRWSKDGKPVLVVANFTPVPRQAYRVGVPFAGRWAELLNSDADTYAGSNYGNGGGAFTEEVPSHGQSLSLELNLPPLAVLILKPEG
jgi:1,4-alpha-glucan branching enzyme